MKCTPPPPKKKIGAGTQGPIVKYYVMGSQMPKQVGNENSKRLLAVGYFWLVQQTLSYSLFLVQQYSLLRRVFNSK